MTTNELAPIPVTAFIDWNAQMHNARVQEFAPLEKARRTLEQAAKTISIVLSDQGPERRFSVGFRLYHGWYKGWEQTNNFRAVQTTISEIDFPSLSYRPNVLFLPNVMYSHTLREALSERRHNSPPIHFPNTLRQQSKDEKPVEKMVDTALATDLLDWARTDPREWALVLAEDDDFVPPLFAAESWIRPYAGRVLLVRLQRTRRAFLKLERLLWERAS